MAARYGDRCRRWPAYGTAGRGLWLSDRPLEERVRMLRDLTEHVQIIYFSRRRRAMTAVPQERARLRIKLDILEGNARPTAPEGSGHDTTASRFRSRESQAT